MNLNNSQIYNLRSNGVAHGDVFTRHEVVAFMLDMVDYTPDRNLSETTIVEPSCGTGEFVYEIIGCPVCRSKNAQDLPIRIVDLTP